jgi:tRNA G18 (ribose-2'-O)-methylase SpoU
MTWYSALDMKEIVLVAHNLRSSHNVGSLLRTAEGLGVKKVYLTGYSPYPISKDDARLPHIASKTNKQIIKTALGAEESINWEHREEIGDVIKTLRAGNYVVAALEQAPDAANLMGYKVPKKIAIVVGRETEGIEPEVLALTDLRLEIPMFGKKESFNVVQAAAMALFYLTFSPNQ